MMSSPSRAISSRTWPHRRSRSAAEKRGSPSSFILSSLMPQRRSAPTCRPRSRASDSVRLLGLEGSCVQNFPGRLAVDFLSVHKPKQRTTDSRHFDRALPIDRTSRERDILEVVVEDRRDDYVPGVLSDESTDRTHPAPTQVVPNSA